MFLACLKEIPKFTFLDFNHLLADFADHQPLMIFLKSNLANSLAVRCP